ncbi:alginate O-acetyltransferase AlgF [Paraburkholderia sp. LEh10]|uniref:alginate O-acetyltransferase AlgF n=1 Tax=Paraburkholderia sp. LEh10 TaxID=2821353 RepID=UPI001AE71D24|nr:alginate O-acetyltransferase AlgF [Paraburkholderia sp. LEh10]MBP0594376.1 alginate O-acetyltransferase AlgF [Paraburkholderia sp. LEh10]
MNRISPIDGSMAASMAAMALLLPATAHAAAGDVASLYGPQPPDDATYLRVINVSPLPARVALAGSEAPQTLAPGAATRFSVLAPATQMHVSVDGKALADATAATGHPGDAVTVALSHDAKGWHAMRVAGRYGRVDGLKATLRAFNFVPGCSAEISVDGAGPTVFAQLASGAQDARAINPVSAKLVGRCGAAASAPLPLPPLAAGESYSLFIHGDARQPVLSGARDALAWPPAAR